LPLIALVGVVALLVAVVGGTVWRRRRALPIAYPDVAPQAQALSDPEASQ
jgi:hypothetical protein